MESDDMGLRDWILRLIVRVDIRQGKRDLRALTKETKKQQGIWNRVRSTIMREQSKSLRSIYAVVVMGRSVLSAAGITLDAATEAAISVLAQGLASAVQIHAIMAASTAGASIPTSAYLVALAFAAYAISEVMILQKADEAARALKTGEAALSGLEMIITPWGM